MIGREVVEIASEARMGAPADWGRPIAGRLEDIFRRTADGAADAGAWRIRTAEASGREMRPETDEEVACGDGAAAVELAALMRAWIPDSGAKSDPAAIVNGGWPGFEVEDARPGAAICARWAAERGRTFLTTAAANGQEGRIHWTARPRLTPIRGAGLAWANDFMAHLAGLGSPAARHAAASMGGAGGPLYADEPRWTGETAGGDVRRRARLTTAAIDAIVEALEKDAPAAIELRPDADEAMWFGFMLKNVYRATAGPLDAAGEQWVLEAWSLAGEPPETPEQRSADGEAPPPIARPFVVIGSDWRTPKRTGPRLEYGPAAPDPVELSRGGLLVVNEWWSKPSGGTARWKDAYPGAHPGALEGAVRITQGADERAGGEPDYGDMTPEAAYAWELRRCGEAWERAATRLRRRAEGWRISP